MEDIELKVDNIEKFKNENPNINIDDFINYKTCCSNSSKGFINYLAKLFISIIIISFCVYMIITNRDDDNSIHYSLISSIMSVYVQPHYNDDKNK